jgi:signal transduction histidine kinase
MNHIEPLAKTPRSGWASLLIALTGRRLIVALVAAVLVSAALNPIFDSPYVQVLWRVLLVAAILLVAFTYAGQWRAKWLPRWLAQVLAVGVAAPAATFLAYLIAVSGDLPAFLNNPNRIAGFFVITVVSLVFGVLLALGALFRERDAQLRAQTLEFALAKEQLERQALDARLGLLQAQIEPHFLFNTLANVQELVETGSPRAGPVFKSLIAYLRASMPQLNQSHATLGHELELVRSYLELMSMRMPDRLSYRLQVDAALGSLRFPPMALLTLVENAVRHGIDPSEDGGQIEVGASRDPSVGGVRVWVIDTGVGMAETATPGTGLSNLRQRINAFFGPQAGLELSEPPPRGLRAEIRFAPEA